MAMLKIGNVDTPEPAKYNVTLQDIDSENTQRTEAGTQNRDRVRGGVYKITVMWKVGDSDLKKITSAVAPASLSVTFYDPTTGTTPTKDMYCGDRSGELRFYKPDGASLWELSLSLIEY